ncbi:hypothetical protein U27_04716 [Candidatus Vecturithrix granuli]|uniref:DUF2442 domain-containing protein n=1 Tax=Vecturithrix granuli TaxID=1499967 RepID=A0A081BZJ4_VECG1|nr:hypothetical protein U27_04716 [Candidatus Vecturithrix granuli]
MLLEVVSANYLGAYKAFLTFNNGYQATVDLHDTVFHDPRIIFRPLRQPEYFKQFTVKLNTMCWENEADFAPEFLYDLALQQNGQMESGLKQAA